MKVPTNILMVIFFASNCLGILFLALHSQKFTTNGRNLQQQTPLPEPISYRFLSPTKAFHILSQLDQYQSPRNNTFLDSLSYISEYRPFHYGLTSDKLYCHKHRLYFVNDPEYIFEKPRIFSDFDKDSVIRNRVIPSIGQDLKKNIGPHMKFEDSLGEHYEINMDASAFFCGNLYTARKIGKEFSCLTQMSNHIPGHTLLTRKDYQAEALFEYINEFQDMPSCFDSNKYFPRAWTLDDQRQCEEFFSVLKESSVNQQRNDEVVYIKRAGTRTNRLDGVRLLDGEFEEKLIKMYEGGELCGKVQNNYVIEKFISNPLLVNNKRFSLKAYMLIASSNPLIVYYYNDGLIKISEKKYQKNKIYEIETSKDSNVWSMEDLERYLIEAKKINGDKNWVENYLRPEMKKALIHLMRITQFSLQKISSLYELFEMEFMIDEELNVWFIQANGFPNLKAESKKEGKLLENMLKDHYEVMNGLLRSRVKRIIQYVNLIIKKKQFKPYGDKILVENVHEKRREFAEITKNWFEVEFEPSVGNRFVKIIDENFSDLEMYNHNLPPACFEIVS